MSIISCFFSSKNRNPIYKKKTLLCLSFGNQDVIGLCVGVSSFTMGAEQLCLYDQVNKDQKVDRLDSVVDSIRKKYGNNSVRRATVLQDNRLSEMDINGVEIKPFDRGGV